MLYNKLKPFSFILFTLTCLFLLIINQKTNIPVSNKGKKKERYENKFYHYKSDSLRLADPSLGKIPDQIRAKEIKFVSKIPSVETSNIQNAKWKFAGPENVGGRTRAIAIDISNENILFAAGISGGLFRSTNKGASWSKVTSPMSDQNISCIAQDIRPGKTNIWFIGTGELRGSSAFIEGNGLYMSNDGGITWEHLEGTEIYRKIMNVQVNHTELDLDEIYAATQEGIIKSSDGGKSWNLVLNKESELGMTDLEISKDGTIYACLFYSNNTEKIWRLNDGINWENITPNSFPSGYA